MKTDGDRVFTLGLMQKHVADLSDRISKEHHGGGSTTSKAQPLKPLNHFKKLMHALGFTEPDADVRGIVPLIEDLLPRETDGLVDKIENYGNSSKSMVCDSFARIMQIEEVAESLFKGDMERAKRVADLFDQKRKWYQNLTQQEARKRKAARPPTPASSVSSVEYDDDGSSLVLAGGGSLQEMREELDASKKEVVDLREKLHHVTLEAERATATFAQKLLLALVDKLGPGITICHKG